MLRIYLLFQATTDALKDDVQGDVLVVMITKQIAMVAKLVNAMISVRIIS